MKNNPTCKLLRYWYWLINLINFFRCVFEIFYAIWCSRKRNADASILYTVTWVCMYIKKFKRKLRCDWGFGAGAQMCDWFWVRSSLEKIKECLIYSFLRWGVEALSCASQHVTPIEFDGKWGKCLNTDTFGLHTI